MLKTLIGITAGGITAGITLWVNPGDKPLEVKHLGEKPVEIIPEKVTFNYSITPYRKPILNLPDYIQKFEGIRYVPYIDSLGFLTVGIGHRLLNKGKPRYTHEEVTNMFNLDLEIAIKSTKKVYVTYDKQPDNIKLILIDLAFNLGETKLRKFVKFNLAINNKDYTLAAHELKDSRYYSQTGNRAKFHYNELLTIGN